MIIYLMPYFLSILIMIVGLYIIIVDNNIFKKAVGLTIFQTAVILLYISMSKVFNGSAPIYKEGVEVYSNPLPHVLMLTAIVVGFASSALIYTFIIKIYQRTKSLDNLSIKE